MSNPEYLSPTRLMMFERCELQYHFRYILGIKSLPGIALHRGGSVHEGIEFNLKHKIETGQLKPLSEVKDLVSDTFDKKVEEEGVVEEEKENIGSAKDSAIRLSELHYTDRAPMIVPVEVEKGIAATIEDMRVEGWIDIVEKDKIIDTKTRSKALSISDLDRNTQFIFYSYALKLEGNEIPFQLDALIDTKVPKVQSEIISYDNMDYELLHLRVANMKKALDAGDFRPCDSSSWICTPKFCGYFKDCAFGRRKRVQK